ncbi:hypothetical protein J14TS2_24350 [Bacillus sp. J14TS2]|uniref:hypothetical protein n=1 Tax=Bacillus sp. J14TS2 TaxID=2807188 RepID=UPI001B068744|nr:hypothetical protein [Bacillus sp. J14TS2]GIN71960.1 hypothetical protein J14TS2_24350 [Bacillus sp. J14TS2]
MINILLWGLLIPLLLIGFLYWKLIRNLATGKGGIFKNKKIVKVLIIIYATALILSPIIYEFLPKTSEEIPRVQDKNLDQKTMELEQAIYDGRLADINPEYIRETWQQPYEGNELNLQQTVEETVPIVIERKQENDGMIEGKYIASVIYQALDFSDKIRSIEFNLSDDTLNLEEVGEFFEFKGITVERDLVLSQFTESRNIFTEGTIRQVRFIYLQIPKDLQLQVNADLSFNYTGEMEVIYNVE